jgi:hypothetical protein
MSPQYRITHSTFQQYISSWKFIIFSFFYIQESQTIFYISIVFILSGLQRTRLIIYVIGGWGPMGQTREGVSRGEALIGAQWSVTKHGSSRIHMSSIISYICTNWNLETENRLSIATVRKGEEFSSYLTKRIHLQYKDESDIATVHPQYTACRYTAAVITSPSTIAYVLRRTNFYYIFW